MVSREKVVPRIYADATQASIEGHSAWKHAAESEKWRQMYELTPSAYALTESKT